MTKAFGKGLARTGVIGNDVSSRDIEGASTLVDPVVRAAELISKEPVS